MNHSLSVFLINDKARAVRTLYDPADPHNVHKSYTKSSIFKTLDPSIKKDDLVIVPTNTRHKFTVVKVLETDVDVDFDSKEEVLWIVDKLDLTIYNKTLEAEQGSLEIIKSAELRDRKTKLFEAIKLDQQALAALPLVNAEEQH